MSLDAVFRIGRAGSATSKSAFESQPEGLFLSSSAKHQASLSSFASTCPIVGNDRGSKHIRTTMHESSPGAHCSFQRKYNESRIRGTRKLGILNKQTVNSMTTKPFCPSDRRWSKPIRDLYLDGKVRHELLEKATQRMKSRKRFEIELSLRAQVPFP